MEQADKPLVWLHGEVKTPPLSRAARIEAGYLLRRLQRGDPLGMPHSRPMKKRLEAKGWKVGSVKEFLDLSPHEAAYVELKLKLADGLREHRRRRRLTQSDVARKVKSSQSRVAKMEAGDPSVSIDLLIRSLLALGASDRDLARIIGLSRTTTSGR